MKDKLYNLLLLLTSAVPRLRRGHEIFKVLNQVAFAILSSRYYSSYLTECGAQCCKEVSKHEPNNREWID